MMDSMDAEIIIDDSLDNAIVNDGIIQDSIVDEGTISDSIDAEEVKLISLVYSGIENDNIIVNVNNESKTISASIKTIQFATKDAFPEVGSDKLIYIDLSNTSLWFFDSNTNTYKEAANTEGLATEDFVNNLLKDYATKDFVEENGGKIDTISINGVAQDIVNKNVDIDLSQYAEAKDLTDIADDLGKEIDETNAKFVDYAKLKANQTFTGSQTIVGNLTIEGNITQNGENYITQAEKVETEDDYILMRKGATGGLGSGYSGFEVENYNGAGDNARLVVDTNGIARVGDVGDEQPLLTREETTDLTDGEVLVWNATTNRAEGSADFEKTAEVNTKLANKRNITNNASKLYATDSDGNQTEVSYGTGLSANMIVRRGAGGQIATQDPTNDVHAVNLQTMNAALEEKYQELYDLLPTVEILD